MKIDFNLLSNASDSIERAIELVAWGDQQGEARRLKQAVQAVAHGIELLLKERLKRIHPSLIWENVDRYPSIGARTVNAEGALSRLQNIGNVEFTIRDVELLRSLRNTRNSIEHLAWTTTKEEADATVGRALEFSFFFSRSELDHEYMDNSAFKDGTYQTLLASNIHFATAIESRKKASQLVSEQEPTLCTACRAKAVDPVSNACRMCGHWQPIYDDAFEF